MNPPPPLPEPGLRPVGDPPAEVLAAFTARGWRLAPDDDQGLYLRWCGDAWEDALEALTELPTERERSRTVLVGHHAPEGLGERVRARGGLTWIEAPPPPWLIDLLRDTLQRSRNERPLHRLRELAPFSDLTDRGPEDILAALAARAGELMGATATAWWATDTRATLRSLRPDDRTPVGLPDAARRWSGLVVVPWLPAARICTPGPVAIASAAAWSVLRATAPDEPEAVITLTWAEPLLPTVAEVRLMELIGLVGRLMVGRTAERERLNQAHRDHVRALTGVVTTRGHEATADELVRRVLATRTPDPELLEVHARLSADSRGTGAWQTWSRTDAPLTEQGLAHILEWVRPTVPAERDEGWVVSAGVGPDGVLGAVIAVFASQAAAASRADTITDMAGALELGAHVLRSAGDADALAELSRGDADADAPAAALDATLQRLVERLCADGARVSLVRRAPTGGRLVAVRSWPAEATPPALADVEAVLTTDSDRQGTSADNTWHLLVPLHSAGRPAGVLETWRTATEPFDRALDPAALRRFAPYVAAAARRLVELERERERVAVMGDLLRQLQQPDPPASVSALASLVTERVRRLASAAAAVLMRRAPGSDLVYVEATAVDDDGLADTLITAVHDTTTTTWPGHAGAALSASLAPWGLALRPRLTLPSPHPDGSSPTSALVLLDLEDAQALTPFAVDIEDAALRELYGYAAVLLENATRELARATAARAVGDRPSQVLAHAAEAAREATHVEAIVLALHDGAGHRVIHTLPERHSLHGERVEVEGGALRPPTVAQLARAYGWDTPRAVAVFPLHRDNAEVGVLVALCGPGGPHIGWHRRQVLAAVAARAEAEHDQSQRRRRLEDLNALSADLAGKAGADLASKLVERLTAWCRQYLHADAEVVVTARAHLQHTLVLAGPPSWSADALRAFNQGSRRVGQREHTFTFNDLERWGAPRKGWGLATPIALVGAPYLVGHVMVTSADPIHARHGPALAEAAREVAVLLDAERVRHGFMAETGLFRHALLSPVQGLTDAAMFLAELVEDPVPDLDQIADQKVRILLEAEKVRQWRTIQRVYGGGLLGGGVTLHRRRQPLRPVIQQCMDRFRVTMARRGVALHLDWQSRVGDMVDFDPDAIDITVSNLLDNAAKYGFANRPVHVEVRITKDEARLTVIDVGHPVPADIDIYASGERMPWEDPFRRIHGEGLGLYIVRHLIVAHGGKVSHDCAPERAHALGPAETRPYLTRFVVHWPRESA
jgi:nitrogen-specific signal transduction histidine kinase